MGNRLRVCFISLMFWPVVGGSEKQAEKQARLLQAFGHDVTIVTLRVERGWKRCEILDGLPVIRVGGMYGSGGHLRMGRLGHFPIDIHLFLKLWHLRHSFDVIHVLQVSPLAGVAACIGEMTKKPVIINLQSTGPNTRQRAQLERAPTLMADTLTDAAFLTIDPARKWMLSGGDIDLLLTTAFGGRAIVNFLRESHALYQVLSTRGISYLRSHGFRLEHIAHIPNGVDTEKFRPIAQQRPDPAGPERNIVCVARLEYAKGVDVLVHAWARMMRAPNEWRLALEPRLLLVGDGKFKPQMERIVEELGLRDSVELLGLRTDIVPLLQRSWGFVLPSRWEGMPNALLEAMACGLPCVATRVSGSEDVISDGINGLLVEPEQPAEMARALQRIIEDIDMAQRLGKQARETVVRDYQLKHIVEQCLELYRYAAQKTKTPIPKGAKQKE